MTNNNLSEIFKSIKNLMKKYEPPFESMSDYDSRYELASKKEVEIAGKKRKEIYGRKTSEEQIENGREKEIKKQ